MLNVFGPDHCAGEGKQRREKGDIFNYLDSALVLLSAPPPPYQVCYPLKRGGSGGARTGRNFGNAAIEFVTRFSEVIF